MDSFYASFARIGENIAVILVREFTFKGHFELYLVPHNTFQVLFRSLNYFSRYTFLISPLFMKIFDEKDSLR